MEERITSAQNPRIKNIVRLRDSSHRKRQKRFLIEGYREIQRALECQWPMESVYFCEDLFKQPDSFDLLHQLEEAGIELVQLAEGPFEKAAFRQGPDGLLAVALQKLRPLEELPLSVNPLFVVLEGLEKPGNIGAIFRTANAAGADGIILAGPGTDPFSPNTIRASQGAFFNMPFCCTDNASIQTFLRENSITPIATSPDAEALIWDAPLDKPIALVFGTEDTGLSDEWTETAPLFRFPMAGISDSLNVASTAAAALFEVVRQRR